MPGHTGGESETIIGKWLKGRGSNRDRIVLATKVGKEMGPGKIGLSPAYIRNAVEASLRRLQTGHIDLYQAHDDDAATPLEETLAAFGALIAEGKVRAIGASNFTAPRLAQALETSRRLGLARYETLQPKYNLYDRASYEAELEPLCLKEGLGVINFYGLAHGFLTGKYRSEADLSKSTRGGGVKEYLNERGMRILRALDGVAKRYDAPPAAVALAWQMARPGITAPIASATSVEQFRELARASALRLDREAMRELDNASAWRGA